MSYKVGVFDQEGRAPMFYAILAIVAVALLIALVFVRSRRSV